MTDDPYLIPGTGTLRNLLDITDADQLAIVEVRITEARNWQLQRGEVTIPGNWDLAHLLAHHHHLFQDIYEWAGEVRTVNISKGSTEFCQAAYIESSARTIFDELASTDHLQGLDRDGFTRDAAHLLSEINVLHPCREGNGRAQRAFLTSLARHAGWDLAWERVDPDQNLRASLAGYLGDEDPIRALLDDITIPGGPTT